MGSQKTPYCCSCNKIEQVCRCDRYCALCQGDYSVRLCEDGYYYCKDCRDACDYRCDNKGRDEIAI
jgi:hypothetical protein